MKITSLCVQSHYSRIYLVVGGNKYCYNGTRIKRTERNIKDHVILSVYGPASEMKQYFSAERKRKIRYIADLKDHRSQLNTSKCYLMDNVLCINPATFIQ